MYRVDTTWYVLCILSAFSNVMFGILVDQTSLKSPSSTSAKYKTSPNRNDLSPIQCASLCLVNGKCNYFVFEDQICSLSFRKGGYRQVTFGSFISGQFIQMRGEREGNHHYRLSLALGGQYLTTEWSKNQRSKQYKGNQGTNGATKNKGHSGPKKNELPTSNKTNSGQEIKSATKSKTNSKPGTESAGHSKNKPGPETESAGHSKNKTGPETELAGHSKNKPGPETESAGHSKNQSGPETESATGNKTISGLGVNLASRNESNSGGKMDLATNEKNFQPGTESPSKNKSGSGTESATSKKNVLGPRTESATGDKSYSGLVTKSTSTKKGNSTAGFESVHVNKSTTVSMNFEDRYEPFGNLSSLVLLHAEKKIWKEARKICQEENARLIKIDTTAKIELFKSTYFPRSRTSFIHGNETWIGLHSIDDDGFEWLDGSKMGNDTVEWNIKHPMKLNVSERCVSAKQYVWLGVKWNTRICSDLNRFVCEKVVSLP